MSFMKAGQGTKTWTALPLYLHRKVVDTAVSAHSTHLCQDAAGPDSRCLSVAWVKEQGRYQCGSQANCGMGPATEVDTGTNKKQDHLAFGASTAPGLWPLGASVR